MIDVIPVGRERRQVYALAGIHTFPKLTEIKIQPFGTQVQIGFLV